MKRYEHLYEKSGVRSFHSTQVNFHDCASEKDYNFYRIQQQIPKDAVIELEDNPHVTVLYGIHDEDAYFKLMRIVKPGRFTIGNLSSFRNPESESDVLIIEIVSPDLVDLNDKFKQNCKFTSTFPNYKPHITLAYVKKGALENFGGAFEWTGTTYDYDIVQFSHKDKYFLPMHVQH